jgi:hypothetical protein
MKRRRAKVIQMESNSARIELDYVRQVGSLSQQDLIRFYEVLAHNLTVSIRAIWSDEGFNDSQKVERMKWINEIMHRVVLKSAALRMGRNECSEADTWGMMQHYISLCPDISADIASATISSYQWIDSQGSAAYLPANMPCLE